MRRLCLVSTLSFACFESAGTVEGAASTSGGEDSSFGDPASGTASEQTSSTSSGQDGFGTGGATGTSSHDETTETSAAETDTSGGIGQRVVLEIDVGVSGAHDDFPLLVRLDPDRITYGETLPQGQDLRFRAADETLLAHEIESWNPAGESWIWVLVPRIDLQNDHIFMDYGDPDVVDALDPSEVWSPRYVAVWHMRPGADEDLLDSSPNAAHLPQSAGGLVPGLVGSAATLAASETLVAPDLPALIPTEALTVEAWIRTTRFSEASIVRSNVFELWARELGISAGEPALDLALELDDSFVSHPVVSPANEWTYIAGVFDGVFERAQITVDDQDHIEISTAGHGLLPAAQTPLTIGTALAGEVDEVRIATQPFEPMYLRAQYLSNTDQLVDFAYR